MHKNMTFCKNIRGGYKIFKKKVTFFEENFLWLQHLEILELIKGNFFKYSLKLIRNIGCKRAVIFISSRFEDGTQPEIRLCDMK